MKLLVGYPCVDSSEPKTRDDITRSEKVEERGKEDRTKLTK
jgi:hypothetical protein